MMTSRIKSAPIFSRLLAVLLTTVLAAQALTFLLIISLPSRTPRLTTLSTIATILRTGQLPDKTFSSRLGAKPWDNWADPLEASSTAELARRLGVRPDRVRVVMRRNPEILGASSSGSYWPWGRRQSSRMLPVTNAPGPDILSGWFEASLEVSRGRWRIVTPNISRVDEWQLEALAWLCGILLAVVPVAWFFARRLSVPIIAFAQAAERLGKDPRGQSMVIEGGPEIAVAAAAFNEMQLRLRRYVDDRTTMVAAIAHDLRTPLMRLALRLQRADPAVRSSCEEDIREIEDMITAALSFVSDIARPASRQRIALRPLVETVVDDMIDLGKNVEIEPGEDAAISADLASLKRMIVNLVNNAIEYGGSARLVLHIASSQVLIDVIDPGPGLPEAELERVFEPFYRVEPSRNRATGGSGLGLASARAVALAHGGDVVLANVPSGGLRARVMLPL